MNKSSILLGFIILFSINCFAQQQKGKFFIGALAEINFYNDESDGDSDYRISNSKRWNTGVPFGFFVSDNILIGLIPSFSRYNYTSEYKNSYFSGNSDRESIQYFIGPFVRGYINISEKVDFFVDLKATLGFGSESYYSRSYSTNSENIIRTNGKLTSFSSGIYPGISIQLSKWLFVDATVGRLGFNLNKYKPDNKSNSDEESKYGSFAFDFNTFKFGLSAKLGK